MQRKLKLIFLPWIEGLSIHIQCTLFTHATKYIWIISNVDLRVSTRSIKTSGPSYIQSLLSHPMSPSHHYIVSLLPKSLDHFLWGINPFVLRDMQPATIAAEGTPCCTPEVALITINRTTLLLRLLPVWKKKITVLWLQICDQIFTTIGALGLMLSFQWHLEVQVSVYTHLHESNV